MGQIIYWFIWILQRTVAIHYFTRIIFHFSPKLNVIVVVSNGFVGSPLATQHSLPSPSVRHVKEMIKVKIITAAL